MASPHDGRDKIGSFYLDKLKTQPLILDRSDEEKSVAADLLREELFGVKMKRWAQGFFAGILASFTFWLICIAVGYFSGRHS
jgi:hypothetical protein